jgi:hypothetical protein
MRPGMLLWLAHLVGNALLLWLGYYWLGLAESDGLHLAISGLVILLFAAGALWLHGTALVYFSGRSERVLGEAAGSALRHLLPLLVLAIVVAGVYGLLAHWYDSFAHIAFLIGSWATMLLRRPVAPERVLDWYHILLWVLRWVVIPVIALPLASRIAVAGWEGFHWSSLGRSRRVVYWLELCVLLLCAAWVPFKLLRWIPGSGAFPLEMASFVARFGLAYLLFVSAVLALEFLTSVGRPRFSHPNTISSP